MAKSKSEFVEQVALEYWLNGETLTRALNKAQADWKASHKRARAFSEKEAKSSLQRIEALTKQSKNRLLRDEIAHDKKISNNKLKEAKRANALIEAENRKSRAKEEKNRKKNSVTGGFENFGGRIGTIASYGAAIVVLNSLRQAFTYVIEKTIEYEKAFTDLSVKSGFTTKEMGMVKSEIYEVAGATKFSTLEITGAATALGKLGFEASEVVEILPQVATVAGATSESLEATAQVFGKIVNAYKFSADAAQNVADRLVQVFNNSALDLEKFNTAFSYVGSAAASTGTSFDELTAAMAILSDRGVTASKIGTGLRNVFTKLGREGDTLRDVIVRVNEEQLSFYEIAELVGRRAANQLFILMESITDFDSLVAESANKFGLAMESNAKQMSTFSAKWDILINNATNKIVGEDADPLSEYRGNLEKTEGVVSRLFDSLNALNILNSKGSETVTSTRLNRSQDFFKIVREQIEAGRAASKDFSEADLEKKLLEPYENLLSRLREGEINAAQFQAGREFRAQVSDLFNDSDGNDVFTAADEYIKGELKSKEEAVKENYNNTLKSFAEFVASATTPANADKLRKSILSGDGRSLSIFESLFETGAKALPEADAKRYKDKLKLLLADRDRLTNEALEDYRKVSSGTSAYEGIAKELKRRDAAILRLDTSLFEDENGKKIGDLRTIKLLDKAVKERLDYINELCTLSETQPFLKNWLLDLGIVCDSAKTSKARTKVKIAQIDGLEQQRAEYEIEKDRLSKLYGKEKDPLEKAKLNNDLINLDKQFLSVLKFNYFKYLKEMGEGREAFAKKYPKQIGEYDAVVKGTQNEQIKDETSLAKNSNTYQNRQLEAEAEMFERSLLLKSRYALKRSAIDLEIKKTDRKDIKARKDLFDERDKLTKDYYSTSEQDLSLWIETLKGLKKELDKNNLNAVFGLDDSATVVGTDKIDEAIKSTEIKINKIREDRNKDLSKGVKGGDTEDFDYFPLIIDAYENVYNVFQEIGERRLELLKEQNARELEEIQNRYNEEQNIVQASLISGIISQEQATEAEERLRKKKIDSENKANKKLFEAQKKQEKQDAIFLGLSSIAQAIANIFAKNAGNPIAVGILTSISAAAITASTAANIDAIGRKKFIPKRYADGGIIEGKSHSQGGVPFTVSGYGGFEAEGGEFIVNKEATKRNLAELERINGKTKSGKRKFAAGGTVQSIGNDDSFNEALLEALNRPVRAFVTDQDLAKSESERNALTAKTNF